MAGGGYADAATSRGDAAMAEGGASEKARSELSEEPDLRATDKGAVAER